MLNLEANSVREHWAAVDPSLAALFEAIERTEDWVVDQIPQVAQRLARLSQAMTGPGAVAALERLERGQLLFIMVYLSTAKAVRLLQWMDEQNEGSGASMLNALVSSNGPVLRAGISESALALTLAQRMRVLQNTRFFRSVFDPQVLASLTAVIQQHREDVHHA